MAPEYVPLCIGDDVRDSLLEDLASLDPGADDKVAVMLASKLIEEMPSCPAGMPIGVDVGAGGGGTRTRTKRAPSAYNLFVGDCLKGGATMSECAKRWKAQKAKR